jgi:hypothetical protein
MPTEWGKAGQQASSVEQSEEKEEKSLFLFNQRMLGVWCLLVLVCLFYVWNAGLKTEASLKKQEAAFRTMELLASKMRLAFPALSGRRTGESLRYGQHRFLALLRQEGIRVRKGRGDWKVRRPGYPSMRIQWKLTGGRAVVLLEALDVEGLRPLSMGL